MDIGGYTRPFPPGHQEVIFRMIRELWPDGYFEGEAGPLPLNIESAPEGLVFLYQDYKAYVSWTAKGAQEDNADQMIQLLWDTESTTVVAGSPNHPLLKKLGR